MNDQGSIEQRRPDRISPDRQKHLAANFKSVQRYKARSVIEEVRGQVGEQGDSGEQSGLAYREVAPPEAAKGREAGDHGRMLVDDAPEGKESALSTIRAKNPGSGCRLC